MSTHKTRPPDTTDAEVLAYALDRFEFSLSTGGHFSQGYYVPRTYYNGGFPIDPHELALDIVSLSKIEKKESESPNPYKIRPNRSFRVSKLIFEKMRLHKNELRRRAASTLELKTIYIWYLEHLLYIALEKNWHWVAVAILKVLFIYDSKEFEAVAKQLDYNPQRFPVDAALRRQKDKIIDELEKWFKGFGIELEKVHVGSKIEEHFKTVNDPSAHVDLVAEILRKIRPVNPLCTLHVQTGSGVNFLASLNLLRQKRAPKNFDDEAEMEIMQLLTCPDCLFSTFKALGFRNWHEKLGLPFLSVPPPAGGPTSRGGGSPAGAGSLGGGGTTQMGKSNVGKTVEGETGEENAAFDLQSALEEREERQHNMPLDSVLVVSDNGTWVRVSLDQSAPAQLHLLPGDSLIEIRGEDDEGSLPLDYHQVRWDLDLEINEPHFFVIELKDDRRVVLTVTYEKDYRTGDWIGATVDIIYATDVSVPDQPDEPESVFWPALWKVAAATVVAGTAAGSIILFSVLLMSFWAGRKSASPTTSDANTRVVAARAASPSPTTSPKSPTVTPTAPTAPRDLAVRPKPEGSGSPATAQVPEGVQPAPQQVAAPQSAENNPPQSPAPPAVRPSPSDTAASNMVRPPESQGASPSERSSSAATSEGTPTAAAPDSASSAAEAAREGAINVKVTYRGEEVQDARVVLADEASGAELAGATLDSGGIYSFLGLKTGSYNLKVEKEGFRPEYRNNIEVRPGKTHVEEVRIRRIADDDPAPESVSDVPAVASASRVGVEGWSEGPYGHDLEATTNTSTFYMEGNGRRMPRMAQSSNSYGAGGAGVARRRRLAAPPAPMYVEVDVDQPVCVDFLQPLSSLESREGQTFATSVLKPVYAGGVEAIPQGSIILGIVSQVRKAASSPDGKGIVAVHFTALQRPTDRKTYDIAGELRGLADDPAAADRRAEAILTPAPPLTKPRMVFVGDEEKGFRVAPIDEADAAMPGKKEDDAVRHDASPKGSEAVVGAGTRVCLSLERKLRLPVSK